jgi:hypothetical protein
MFFTLSSSGFESGRFGEQTHKRGDGAVAEEDSAGLAESNQTRLNYSMEKIDWQRKKSLPK